MVPGTHMMPAPMRWSVSAEGAPVPEGADAHVAVVGGAAEAGEDEAEGEVLQDGDDEDGDARDVPGAEVGRIDADDEPPEEEAAGEEAGVLNEVEGLAVNGGVVEGGNVPDPDGADEDDHGDGRIEADLEEGGC